MKKLGKVKGGKAADGSEVVGKTVQTPRSKIADVGQVIGLNALQSAGGQAAREAADDAIMGDKSRRAIRLRELMEQGYTEEAAQKILIEQDIRAMASIAPIVAGGVQYGAARAMRAASDIDDIVRRHEYGDEADPSFTDTDMEIAEILQEDAPRKPFTDEADGGIVEESQSAESFSDYNQQSSSITYKVTEELAADQVNQTFKEVFDYEPPYSPGTSVKRIELTQTQKFVRVYDGVQSKMQGGWVMDAKEIEGLSPKEIQNKFALLYEPKYVCDVSLPAGTVIRMGTANALFGYEGGGLQYDFTGQFIGEFYNERPIGGN